MTYEEFILTKRHSTQDFGIDPNYLPECLFDYQKHVGALAIKKGRCAVFLDTGLGKTMIELVTAQNYRVATGKPVLIITPLAVAFQHVREAQKFDLCDTQYSKDGKYSADVVVCNYERLSKFSPDDFDCVILDESSILKNFDGKIKAQVTSFMKRVKYRFLFTATPSPNDYIELGTSSEALGYMGYTDMLGKFFSNRENNIKAQDRVGSKFYLKPHATEDFFRWVSSWSISMRKPSDLGFADDRHVLPELIINHHPVANPHNAVVNGQIMMFPLQASRLTEVREEVKMTVNERCEKAAELCDNDSPSVVWCNRNDEGEALQSMIKNAAQIRGSMSIDQKEEVLLAFANGEIPKLITKPKMTAFGLNWQHCNHTVYFPTYSYEQWYQSIRRFYRFGQKRDVTADMVYSDGQGKVIQSLLAKANKASELFEKLNANLHSDYQTEPKTKQSKIQLPKFI